MLGLCQAQSNTAGIHFVHHGETYVSSDSWILSLSVDLEPYTVYIKELRREVTALRTAFEGLSSRVNASVETSSLFSKLHADIQFLMGQELDHFDVELAQVRLMYNDLSRTFLSSSSRSKRAVLPFVGSALSWMFGTTSESQFKKIRGRFNALERRQESTDHVLEAAITVLNTTQTEVSLNREAINQLSQLVSQMRLDVQQLIDKTLVLTSNELVYSELVSRTHSILHVATSTLRQTFHALFVLRDQLQSAVRGHYPLSLLPSIRLKGILKRISALLPPGFVLPYRFDNLIDFYRHVPVNIASHDSTVYLSLAIPVAPAQSLFHIYRPVAVPMPSVVDNQVIEYNLEPGHLAVSQDRKSYMLLPDTAAQLCAVQGVQHCQFNLPKFDSQESPICLTAMFFRDQAQISHSCTIQRRVKPQVPVAEHLFDGTWLMFAPEPLYLDLNCLDSDRKLVRRHVLQVTAPVSLVEVPPACSASCKHFELPPHYHNESSEIARESFHIDRMTLDSLQLFGNESIDAGWSASTEPTPDAPLLPSLSPSDLSHLAQQLQHKIEPMYVTRKDNALGLIIIISVIGALVLAGTLVILTLVYGPRCQALCNARFCPPDSPVDQTAVTYTPSHSVDDGLDRIEMVPAGRDLHRADPSSLVLTCT